MDLLIMQALSGIRLVEGYGELLTYENEAVHGSVPTLVAGCNLDLLAAGRDEQRIESAFQLIAFRFLACKALSYFALDHL
jgi:hypothetical protein